MVASSAAASNLYQSPLPTSLAAPAVKSSAGNFDTLSKDEFLKDGPNMEILGPYGWYIRQRMPHVSNMSYARLDRATYL